MSGIRDINEDRAWFQPLLQLEGYWLSEWLPSQFEDHYIATLSDLDGDTITVRLSANQVDRLRPTELIQEVRNTILRVIDEHRDRKAEKQVASIITNQRQLREG